MAGRFFGSSAASIAMIVTNTPSQELALTNLAYISASDLPKFAVPGHSNLYLASIGDVFVFSLSYPLPYYLLHFITIPLFIFYVNRVLQFISVELIFLFFFENVIPGKLQCWKVIIYTGLCDFLYLWP